MAIKARFSVMALLAGALFLTSGAVVAGAATTPSQAAQNAFVKKVDASEITGIPDKVIAALGVSICGLMENGKSATYVNNTLTVPSKATDASSFPQQFVTILMVQASKLMCPKEEAKVQSFVSSGKKAKPLVTDQSLSSLLPPESDKCTASKTVT